MRRSRSLDMAGWDSSLLLDPLSVAPNLAFRGCGFSALNIVPVCFGKNLAESWRDFGQQLW